MRLLSILANCGQNTSKLFLHGCCDCLALGTDEKCQSFGNGFLLLAINFDRIDELTELLDNRVYSEKTFSQKKQVFNDNFLKRLRRLRVAKGFKESCLELRLHGFSRVSVTLLNRWNREENLQFQLLCELVIYNTDKSTTNFDNLLLNAVFLAEFKKILENEGCSSTRVNRTMHNGRLSVQNCNLDALCQTEHS